MSGIPGYDPFGNQGGGVPQPAIPQRLAQGGLPGVQISQSPEAQRALWAQQMGLDLNQPLNDFGRFIMSRYQDVVRPWLGAMIASGNAQSAVPELIGQFANVAQGNGLDEFLRGSTAAFLSNPRLQQRLAGTPGRDAAGMLRDIVGLGQAPFDPVFGQMAEEAVSNAFGQVQLNNAGMGQGNRNSLLDFLQASPEWNWMLR